jgi:WD40 repeat protein
LTAGRIALMPKISISYRRADSEAMTGRIFDRLTSHFGKEAIFRDIDDIPPGIDFRVHINETLRKTNILLAIVGPAWLGGAGGGLDRIQEESDPVRVEVETALRRRVPIIPVLIGNTRMPSADQLPPGLKDFAFRNAVKVDTGQDFDYHMDRLIRSMDAILDQLPKSPPSGESKIPVVKTDTASRRTVVDTPGRKVTGSRAAAGADVAQASAEGLRPSFTVTLPRVSPPVLWPADRQGRYIRLAAIGAAAIAIAIAALMMSGGGDERRLLAPLKGHTGTVSALAFSPNSRLFASGSYDRSVRIWETSTGASLQMLPGEDAVYAVDFEPHNKRVFSGGKDGVITIRDYENGRRVEAPLRPDVSFGWDRLPPLLALALAPDGVRLASGYGNTDAASDSTIRIWNYTTGALLRTAKGHSNAVNAVIYSPDGKTVISGSADGTVRTWDADSARPLLVLRDHAAPVFTVAVSPDGARIAAGGSGGAVVLWDMSNLQAPYTFATQLNAVNALVFTQGGRRLAVGGSDSNIQIWDVEARQLLRSLTGYSGSIHALAISPDGRRLAAGCEDGTISIWSAD